MEQAGGQLRGTAGGSSQNRKHWGQTHKYSQTSTEWKQCRMSCLMFTQTCKQWFCTWPSPGLAGGGGTEADSLGSRTVGPAGREAPGGSQGQSPGGIWKPGLLGAMAAVTPLPTLTPSQRWPLLAPWRTCTLRREME